MRWREGYKFSQQQAILQRDNILNTARQLKQIGINPTMAMGNPGSAPVNFTMPGAPVGQGGRAMGTYQRKSPVEAMATLRLAQQDEHIARMQNNEFEQAMVDLDLKRTQSNIAELQSEKLFFDTNRYLKSKGAPPLPKNIFKLRIT